VQKRRAAGLGFRLAIDYPERWHVLSRAVPNLYTPRELCTISNRPIRPVPITSQQNRPNLSYLDASGVLIWVYYEVHGEVMTQPPIRDPLRPPIPDYSRYSYPLVYGESQLFPRLLDYEWSPDILWRRVGRNLAPTAARPERAALTVMVWEGVRTSTADVRSIEEVVASVSVSDV